MYVEGVENTSTCDCEGQNLQYSFCGEMHPKV